MTSTCPFCDIISGSAPANIIFENQDCIAFSTIKPVAKGHTLLIPKKHSQDLFDTSSETMAQLGSAAKELAALLMSENSATGINILHASGVDAQQSVFHFHFHLIPRYSNDGLDLWIKSKL